MGGLRSRDAPEFRTPPPKRSERRTPFFVHEAQQMRLLFPKNQRKEGCKRRDHFKQEPRSEAERSVAVLLNRLHSKGTAGHRAPMSTFVTVLSCPPRAESTRQGNARPIASMERLHETIAWHDRCCVTAGATPPRR